MKVRGFFSQCYESTSSHTYAIVFTTYRGEVSNCPNIDNDLTAVRGFRVGERSSTIPLHFVKSQHKVVDITRPSVQRLESRHMTNC